jgi:ribulose-phosphate 3-epimerase
MRRLKIAPSLLAADFTRLGEQIRDAEAGGADWLHVDVMDGRFVPNISFGPIVVKTARSISDLTIDTHLMIVEPEKYIETFAEAGANRITVHVETCPHLHRTVQMIRELGVAPGVTLNPATPLESLSEILPYVDMVLIMSVNPGFGGQKYIPASTDRIARLRSMLDAIGSDAEIEVDGGIAPDTAPHVVEAGATVLVAGSAVFNSRATVAENIAALRRSIE